MYIRNPNNLPTMNLEIAILPKPLTAIDLIITMKKNSDYHVSDNESRIKYVPINLIALLFSQTIGSTIRITLQRFEK